MFEDDDTRESKEDILFKGATRPPEKYGMPLIPLISLVGFSIALVFFFKSPYPLIAVIFLLPVMFIMGRRDPKFLEQVVLKIQFSRGLGELFCRKGASYEPNDPKIKISVQGKRK